MKERKYEQSSWTCIKFLTEFGHKGLLFKLKQAGINATLLQCLSKYHSDIKERVLILGGILAGNPLGQVSRKALFQDRYCS